MKDYLAALLFALGIALFIVFFVRTGFAADVVIESYVDNNGVTHYCHYVCLPASPSSSLVVCQTVCS